MRVRFFEQTNSTRLELQTLLWALDETNALASDHELALTVYKYSQNIIGLPERRFHLERNNYFSSKNRQRNNYDLYQEFYRLISKLNCEFVKVLGHQHLAGKAGLINYLVWLIKHPGVRCEKIFSTWMKQSIELY